MRVILLAMGRSWVTRMALRALQRQGCGGDRVHVVVDGDPADFLSLQAEFIGLDVVGSPRRPGDDRRHTSAVRNIGAMRAVAAGERQRLLFLDGDIIPGGHVVAEHERLGDTAVIGCGVRQEVDEPLVWDCREAADPWAVVQQLPNTPDLRFATDTAWRRERMPHVLEMCRGPTPFFTLCYSFQVSYPVQEFLRAGGFWTQLEFREDQELAHRLRSAGVLAQILPDAHSVHVAHPASPLRRAAATAMYEWAISHPAEVRA